MSNNKQSSIEWLYNKMYEHRGNITIEEFEQAKEMHKEECIKYYVDSIDYGDIGLYIRESFIEIAEKVYNKTFGGNNED